MSRLSGNRKLLSRCLGDCSPIGATGPTGVRLSPIMSPIMSFAIAEYVNRRRDIVMAADGRWINEDGGIYSIVDDAGLKSIDLGPCMAVAFTGHARVMAEIVRDLYDDQSLLDLPHRNALKLLEAKPHNLASSMETVVTDLNSIVPRVLNRLGPGYRLSMTLAGRGEHGLTMYSWAEETRWIGRENPLTASSRLRTLPPEAAIGTAIQKRVDMVLDGHGTARQRIQRAVRLMGDSNEVRSVGGECVFRLFSKRFAR